MSKSNLGNGWQAALSRLAQSGGSSHGICYNVTHVPKGLVLCGRMSHSNLAEQWEAVGSIRDKARKLELAGSLPYFFLLCTHVFQLKAQPPAHFEVTIPGQVFDRDAVKSNIPVLTAAINALGLRVGIALTTTHVKALYDYMKIPCPGSLGCSI